MRDHKTIIAEAGAERVRQLLEIGSVHTVRSWSARDSIPAEHWSALVEAGLATLEELAAAASRRLNKRAA